MVAAMQQIAAFAFPGWGMFMIGLLYDLDVGHRFDTAGSQ
jgi:hypothetical protein